MRDLRRFAAVLTAVFGCCQIASADVGSTADEWAARFIPESANPPALPEYATTADRVAADLDAGLYHRAFSDLAAATAADASKLGLLKAKASIGLGERDAAMQTLSTGTLADDPAAITARIEMLLEQEQPTEAMPLIDRLLSAQPNGWSARLLKGQALEMAGQFKQAINAYHWFLSPPQNLLHRWQSNPDGFDDAADLTALATALNRWATLTSAYKDAQTLNDTVLAMYTRAFDVIDRGNLPARLAAVRFCLSRGDVGQAGELFAPAQKRFAANRDVLRVMGELAVAQGSEGAMQQVADTLRNEDPDSVDAALVEIVQLTRARSVAAAARVDRLYANYPARTEVAGAAAALAYINGDAPALDTRLKQIDATFPTRADAYGTAAQLLDMAFQRDAAVRLLKVAVSRTPWDPTAYHLMGDLYLNDGYNDQAHAVLDQAYALDPYNVKTLNYLRLLDDLAKYDQRVSEHFIVYSDKDADPVAADQIGPFMERSYDEVCKVFDYQPKTKIVVQIYSEDDQFSVRMAGVPGVENFGVSFGRVLATIAPRKGTKQGNFNFARVLKHEFVHTINLLQTNQHCPRWLTEGLAVWQEHVPFRFAGVPRELYKRTMDDTLFTIRGFPLAYIRPTRPDDGEQAYTQGAYLAMYMEDTFGRGSIVKLLNAYGRSESDEQAFKDATGEPMSKLENDWHAWMKVKLKSWNYDKDTDERVAVLEKEGEQFLTAKKLPEALQSWQAACDLQPTEVKPHQRLAGLYLQKTLSDPAKAIEHLSFLHFLQFQDGRYARQISKLYTRLDDAERAAHWAREATYVDLYDPVGHDMLATALRQLGKTADADAEAQTATQLRLWEQKRADANR